MKKKLYRNDTRILRAILNKFGRQHPTKQQLYCHLAPISKTIQVRRTRHAGHCWRSKDKLISDIILWTPTQVADQQIQDVVWMTSRERRMIGTDGEREPEKSVQLGDNESSTMPHLWDAID